MVSLGLSFLLETRPAQSIGVHLLIWFPKAVDVQYKISILTGWLAARCLNFSEDEG
jgi:hypothetical protein